MNNQQKINCYGSMQGHKGKKRGAYIYNFFFLIARPLAYTMIVGAIAILLLFSGQKNTPFTISPVFATFHNTGAIQGHRIDQNESLSDVAATITITNTSLIVTQSLRSNPYTSGLIPAGTYTVSSSQPAGYNVSYSTSPTGGPSTYVPGAVATVTVTQGQTVNLWWKYTLTGPAIQGFRVDQNGATINLASTITISGVGPFTTNPYNSGTIGPGTYTVSSSQPAGYSVSYSTNPTGGASTYRSGSVATITLTAGQTVDLWWKYTPITNSIQGYKVDQNNVLSNAGAIITIDGVGSFTDNPYNSGQISPGIYTVSSSQPEGYSVSYSTNPTDGASTYVSGATATITVIAGRNVILWWKYTPVAATSIKGSIQGSRVNQDGLSSSVAATITISGIGSFAENPYNSGQIPLGNYTVSSSQPAGYSVSYSTNPAGGAATYVSGSITTVQVTAGQITNLWWKYTPIAASLTTGAIQGFRIDQDGKVTDAGLASITINGVGSFRDNPYNSGQIEASTYTVSSSKSVGYNVSYSTNPAAGASSYTAGTIAIVTVTAGQTVNVWWKYTPITSSIQGYKVDESGQPISVLAQTPITIYGIGTFTDNPYNSGQITLGTYTVSSAEPPGYHVSHSINPEGGDAGYTSGSTATLTVAAGQTANLWWKYTPVPRLDLFTLELDNLQSSYSPSVLTHKEIRRMWFGSLTNNFSPAIHSSPDLSNIPRADKIFYSEYINGSWTKPLPDRTFTKRGFQINDPSVIEYPGVASLIYMYYTALADNDAAQKIFDRHTIGLALSIDEGRSWQDKGIVIDYPESGDGKGASSPSAIAVGDEIWVYYHTGTSDFNRPINWRVKFSLNTFSILKTGLPERLNFSGFIQGDPNWILTNLDVSYRNSQFVMLANTSNLKKVVRFVSDDGINWREPASGQNPIIEIPNYLALTPVSEDTSPNRYKIFFGLGATSGSNVVSTMIRSREFSTTASVPLTPEAFVFTTDMSIGQTSEDVRALQTCLAQDTSIYPEGLITAYFGTRTQRAVIRFQEKFASAILTPAGLVNGNGFAGPLTRAKLNQVCGQ